MLILCAVGQDNSVEANKNFVSLISTGNEAQIDLFTVRQSFVPKDDDTNPLRKGV